MSDSLEAAAHGYAAIEERKRNALPPPPTQDERRDVAEDQIDLVLQRGFVVTVLDEHGNYLGDMGARSLLAALRQRGDAATKAENEACAAIAEKASEEHADGYEPTAMRIAAAIRARITP